MENSEICRYVFSLGVSPKHKGFVYICEALAELFPAGAPVFDVGAALESVCALHGIERHAAERCMRYAVCCAWDAREGILRRAFAELCPGAAGDGRLCPAPSLAEFLHVAVWRMQGEK